MRFALPLIAGLWLLAAPVTAQTGVEEARALFEQGLAQFDAGELGRAEALFRRSLAVRRSSAAAFNLGRVLEQIGGLAEARGLFEEVAASEGVPPQIAVEARQRAAALERRVARVTVQAADPAVEARVDGDPVPLGVASRVDPGEHVVTARLGDYVLHDERLQLAEAEARVIRVTEIPHEALAPAVVVERGDDTLVIVLVVALAVAVVTGAAIGIGVGLSQGCDAGNVLDSCIRAGM